VAVEVGFETVEAKLRKYAMLPDEFFTQSVSHIYSLRRNMLAGA
jgi:hypothetical protein